MKNQQNYQKSPNIELLNKKQISQYLSAAHQRYLERLLIFKELPSTNTYLKERAKKSSAKVEICFAESQSEGRGQYGNRWFSPLSGNIYLSVSWRFQKKLTDLTGLSLAVAIAVSEALERYGIKTGIALKWPNDILWRKKKLAGILIEIEKITPRVNCAIIGIGLNVAMPKEIGKNISQPWVDLTQIIKKAPQRNKIAGLLLDELFTTLELFQKHGFKPFQEKWQTLDLALGKRVTLVTANGAISGISRGINENGYFLLENREGEIQTFASGGLLM